MTLQYKFFIIPALDIEAAEEEVNRFLRSVRVVKAHRSLDRRCGQIRQRPSGRFGM